jgi:hypothetical protein
VNQAPPARYNPNAIIPTSPTVWTPPFIVLLASFDIVPTEPYNKDGISGGLFVSLSIKKSGVDRQYFDTVRIAFYGADRLLM